MAFVTLNETSSAVIAAFKNRQNEPVPTGYAEIADDDARYVAFVSPAKIVPKSVSMAQARVALSRASLLSSVQSAVDGAGGETVIWWDYATLVERNHPIVFALATALSLTGDQVDDLFIQAATIL